MLHHYIREKGDRSGEHWGVSKSHRSVLVQIQEGPLQCRIELSPEQAEEFAAELLRFAALRRAEAQAAVSQA